MKQAIRDDLEASQAKVTIQRDSIRLNKYLSESGYCSRRQADRYIEDGAVFVDGIQAVLGTFVEQGQSVSVHGKTITRQSDAVYLVLNKPIGITCTTDEMIEGNLTSFMQVKQRIFPIGRLDKESSGLLLMTSDGDVVNQILRSENNHDKEYIVTLNRPYDQAFLNQMASGVEIYNMVSNRKQTTKPCVLKPITDCIFSLVLTEGLNRQIRRMTQALGYRVVELKRVRIMHIELGDLEIGHWRYLNQAELSELKARIHSK